MSTTPTTTPALHRSHKTTEWTADVTALRDAFFLCLRYSSAEGGLALLTSAAWILHGLAQECPAANV